MNLSTGVRISPEPYPPVAQWKERMSSEHSVGGSNPSGRAKGLNCMKGMSTMEKKRDYYRYVLPEKLSFSGTVGINRWDVRVDGEGIYWDIAGEYHMANCGNTRPLNKGRIYDEIRGAWDKMESAFRHEDINGKDEGKLDLLEQQIREAFDYIPDGATVYADDWKLERAGGVIELIAWHRVGESAK